MVMNLMSLNTSHIYKFCTEKGKGSLSLPTTPLLYERCSIYLRHCQSLSLAFLKSFALYIIRVWDELPEDHIKIKVFVINI